MGHKVYLTPLADGTPKRAIPLSVSVAPDTDGQVTVTVLVREVESRKPHKLTGKAGSAAEVAAVVERLIGNEAPSA